MVEITFPQNIVSRVQEHDPRLKNHPSSAKQFGMLTYTSYYMLSD